MAWLDTAHGAQGLEGGPQFALLRGPVSAPATFWSPSTALPVDTQVQVTKRLWRAGLWTQVRYKLVRNGQEFETPLVTAPAEKPASIENYERVVGLLYLFIGLFIFIRRWNAPRAVHFYVFCLVSFILYLVPLQREAGRFRLGRFIGPRLLSLMLAPALLLHFALVFPERAEATARSLSKLHAGLWPACCCCCCSTSALALNALGFVPWLGSRVFCSTKLSTAISASISSLPALVFYKSFREAPSGVLRQQLKWLTGGTLAGSSAVRAACT